MGKQGSTFVLLINSSASNVRHPGDQSRLVGCGRQSSRVMNHLLRDGRDEEARYCDDGSEEAERTASLSAQLSTSRTRLDTCYQR